MRIADLHIHSKYSRATSRDCDVPHLDLWARRKGIDLVGAGDCTHAGWRETLRQVLTPAEEGLYTLRENLRLPDAPAGAIPRFVISGEISLIYRKLGRVRRVHLMLLLPSLEAADAVSRALAPFGKLASDGRPILSLDCRDAAELLMTACPQALLIPAHIWTPHFSMCGAFTAFDTVEQCFGDMARHIHALETGLSADPAMFGRLSTLDAYTLISNSDAHSPAKLGREATLLDIALSYPALADALNGINPSGVRGTLEFFPEEGKYHLDGHRACGVCLTPAQTLAQGGRCPVCGGKLTVGVLNRIEFLADRPAGAEKQRHFESLTPLPAVISACTGLAVGGVRVARQYLDLVQTLGPELYILRQAPLSDIRLAAGAQIAEGIRRLRQGKVMRSAGFDGQTGKIDLFSPEELLTKDPQISLFSAAAPSLSTPTARTRTAAQQEAVRSSARVTAVCGAAGTGKTEVLAARIAYMLRTLGIRPAHIVVITPTRRAAAMLKAQLHQLLGSKRPTQRLLAGTFAEVALHLRPESAESPLLLAPDQCTALCAQIRREADFSGTAQALQNAVSALKNGADEQTAGIKAEQAALYDWRLRAANAVDETDLLLDEATRLTAQKKRQKPMHVLVAGFDQCTDAQYRFARALSARGTLFVTAIDREDTHPLSCLAAQEPALHTVFLTENHRTAPEILRCTQSLLPLPHPMHQTALRQAGGLVRAAQVGSPREEAALVAREIAAAAGGVKAGKFTATAAQRFAEIAVFCPEERQLHLLERTLARAGIPCAVAGRGAYLQAACVQGALSFLRFLENPLDAVSLRTCLRASCKLSERRIDSAAKRIAAMPPTTPATERLAFAASTAQDPTTHQALAALQALLPAQKLRPAAFLARWASAHVLENHADFHRFCQLAAAYSRAEALLSDLSIGAEADLVYQTAPPQENGVLLSVLPLAAAFPRKTVYLCGLTDGVSTAKISAAMLCAMDLLILTLQPPSDLLFAALARGGAATQSSGKITHSNIGAQLHLFE